MTVLSKFSTSDAAADVLDTMNDINASGRASPKATLLPDWQRTGPNPVAPIIGGRIGSGGRRQRIPGRRCLASLHAKGLVYNGSNISQISDVATTDPFAGSTALQLVTDTTSTQHNLAPATANAVVTDVTGGIIRFHVKSIANVNPNLALMEIRLFSGTTPASPGANYHKSPGFVLDFRNKEPTGTTPVRWSSFSMPASMFTAVGNGADLTQVAFAQLVIASTYGSSLTIQIGAIEYIPNGLKKAKAILSFDDGKVGQAGYIAQQLIRYAFPAVLYPSPVKTTVSMNDGFFLRAEQLLNYQNLHGWQIASQAWSTEDVSTMTAMTDVQATQDMAQLRAWHASLGLEGGHDGSYFSSVGWGVTAPIGDAFRKNFRTMRGFYNGNSSGAAFYVPETYPFGDPMRLRALNGDSWSDTTIGNKLIAHAQQAIDHKGVAFFAWHDSPAGAGNAQDGFNALLSFLDANRASIDVVTIDDLYAL